MQGRHHRVGHPLGFEHRAGWRPRGKAGQHRFALRKRTQGIGIDETGADGVDANPARPQLYCQAAYERFESRLPLKASLPATILREGKLLHGA